MEKLKAGEKVLFKTEDKYDGKNGVVTESTSTSNDYYWVKVDGGNTDLFKRSELTKITKTNHDETQISLGNTKNFTKIGTEIGEFTDKKNLQYGSSVDATSKMMHVLLERYTYDDGQYLIPKSLIEHILLQSRMMDKINRVFNNPSGEGDSESPYNDLAGYSLIGIEMTTGGDTK